MRQTPPLVLCLAGLSDSGKTSLAERLVPRLVARGLRVGYLKANAHRIDLDREGKDTDRLHRAGAAAVAIHSDLGAVHFPQAIGPSLPRHSNDARPRAANPEERCDDSDALDHSVRARLWNLRGLYRGCDLLLVEGMKGSVLPKVLVTRDDRGGERLEASALRGWVREIRYARMPEEEEWEPHLEQVLDWVRELSTSPARRAGQELAGIVVAGGVSTRMGRDKALLPVPGWPVESADFPVAGTWLERAFLLLAERTAAAWIVGRIATAGDAALPLLEWEVRSHLDLEGGEGPLGGLATAFAISEGRGVLMLPCDLPLLSPAALDLLLTERRGAATAFRHADGRAEPAVAIVEAIARPGLQASLVRRERRLESFLNEIGVHWVDLPADLSPGFRNMNRPRDLAV